MKNWYYLYFAACIATFSTAMDNPGNSEIDFEMLKRNSRFDTESLCKGETPFTRAIIQADLVTVESMLQQNKAFANEPNKEGVPPLFIAAAGCECNKSPDQEPIDPQTQKKVCVCVLITQRLLDAGANKDYYLACPEDRTSDYGTPIMAAFAAVRLRTFHKILEFKPDLSIPKPDGTTILLMAANSGRKKEISALIAAGADVMHKDKADKNALYYCGATEEMGDTAENVQLLVDAGVNINQVYQGGNNILMLALKRDTGPSNYYVGKLIEMGLYVHHKNNDEQTALNMVKANDKLFMRDYIIPILERAEREQPRDLYPHP